MSNKQTTNISISSSSTFSTSSDDDSASGIDSSLTSSNLSSNDSSMSQPSPKQLMKLDPHEIQVIKIKPMETTTHLPKAEESKKIPTEKPTSIKTNDEPTLKQQQRNPPTSFKIPPPPPTSKPAVMSPWDLTMKKDTLPLTTSPAPPVVKQPPQSIPQNLVPQQPQNLPPKPQQPPPTPKSQSVPPPPKSQNVPPPPKSQNVPPPPKSQNVPPPPKSQNVPPPPKSQNVPPPPKSQNVPPPPKSQNVPPPPKSQELPPTPKSQNLQQPLPKCEGSKTTSSGTTPIAKQPEPSSEQKTPVLVAQLLSPAEKHTKAEGEKRKSRKLSSKKKKSKSLSWKLRFKITAVPAKSPTPVRQAAPHSPFGPPTPQVTSAKTPLVIMKSLRNVKPAIQVKSASATFKKAINTPPFFRKHPLPKSPMTSPVIITRDQSSQTSVEIVDGPRVTSGATCDSTQSQPQFQLEITTVVDRHRQRQMKNIAATAAATKNITTVTVDGVSDNFSKQRIPERSAQPEIPTATRVGRTTKGRGGGVPVTSFQHATVQQTVPKVCYKCECSSSMRNVGGWQQPVRMYKVGPPPPPQGWHPKYYPQKERRQRGGGSRAKFALPPLPIKKSTSKKQFRRPGRVVVRGGSRQQFKQPSQPRQQRRAPAPRQSSKYARSAPTGYYDETAAANSEDVYEDNADDFSEDQYDYSGQYYYQDDHYDEYGAATTTGYYAPNDAQKMAAPASYDYYYSGTATVDELDDDDVGGRSSSASSTTSEASSSPSASNVEDILEDDYDYDGPASPRPWQQHSKTQQKRTNKNKKQIARKHK